METKILRSRELTLSQVKSLCELFTIVFEKTMTVQEFDEKFIQRNAYHCLLLNDDTIVGCYSCIPVDYIFFGKELKFALSVDTMIHEKYRGKISIFKSMALNLYEKLKDEGISFVFGFPNENVHLVRKKILKWNDIGFLDVYAHPINISKLQPKVKLLSVPAGILSKFSNYLSMLFGQKKITQDKLVRPSRCFSYMGSTFSERFNLVNQNDGSKFSFTIHAESDAKIAYIIDCHPMSMSILQNAVRYISKNHSSDVDAVFYIGSLDFVPINLLKVPKKFVPKNIVMSGVILNSTLVDERIFDLSNWKVNLSSFDVR